MPEDFHPEALKVWKNQRRLTVADFRHYLYMAKPNVLLFDLDRIEFYKDDTQFGMYDKQYD